MSSEGKFNGRSRFFLALQTAEDPRLSRHTVQVIYPDHVTGSVSENNPSFRGSLSLNRRNRNTSRNRNCGHKGMTLAHRTTAARFIADRQGEHPAGGRHLVAQGTIPDSGTGRRAWMRTHRRLATHWKYCLTCAEYISLAARSLRSKSVSYLITSAGTPFSFLLMCCCSSLFRK